MSPHHRECLIARPPLLRVSIRRCPVIVLIEQAEARAAVALPARSAVRQGFCALTRHISCRGSVRALCSPQTRSIRAERREPRSPRQPKARTGSLARPRSKQQQRNLSAPRTCEDDGGSLGRGDRLHQRPVQRIELLAVGLGDVEIRFVAAAAQPEQQASGVRLRLGRQRWV